MTVGLTGALVWGAAHPVAADNAQVGTWGEAWYRGSIIAEDDPACSQLPVGCPKVAAPEEEQSEDTLHVGVSGGREVARTYFELDLTTLPSEHVIDGGTVHLPVAGADAGTAAPELAELVACAVPGFVEPVEGGPPEDAPETDCDRSAVLTFDTEAGEFTFDLGPLTTGKASMLAVFSVAVLPADAAKEQGQTWRVVFHGRDRNTDDAQPISADIDYTIPSGSDPGDSTSNPKPNPKPNPSPTTPPLSGSGPDATSQGPGIQPPPPAPTLQPSDESEVPTPVVAEPQPSPSDDQELVAAPPIVTGYSYPQVWLLPLVFLMVGGLLARSLTGDYEVEVDGPTTAAYGIGGGVLP